MRDRIKKGIGLSYTGLPFSVLDDVKDIIPLKSLSHYLNSLGDKHTYIDCTQDKAIIKRHRREIIDGRRIAKEIYFKYKNREFAANLYLMDNMNFYVTVRPTKSNLERNPVYFLGPICSETGVIFDNNNRFILESANIMWDGCDVVSDILNACLNPLKKNIYNT